MSQAIHHALVLAAGLGTRLAPLTTVRAKPAIPVGGEPIVRRIVAWLAKNGVTDVVVNLHHLPHTIAAVLGDGRDLGVRVRYSWEQPAILGSAGGPRLALPILGVEHFFIVNGDTMTDVDLGALARDHMKSGALATLALVRNNEPHRYGGVRLDLDGGVAGFPRRGAEAEGSFHFVGVQAASAGAFDAVPEGQAASSIGEVYNALLGTHPGSVRGFVGNLSFWDVGTPADYLKTSESFAPDGSRGRGCRIDPTARITKSILWDDVEVGADAELDRCIVTDGVRVPAGSRYARSILMNNVQGGGELAVTRLEV
jgi:NDP-sugar pyrophosphorylase family protein